MGIFDRSAEVGTGRWHVRLVHPANIVTFEYVIASSIDDAIGQAQALHPGYVAEWAVLKPFRPGVFGPGGPGR